MLFSLFTSAQKTKNGGRSIIDTKRFLILFLVLALSLCSCALGEAIEADEPAWIYQETYEAIREAFKPTVLMQAWESQWNAFVEGY